MKKIYHLSYEFWGVLIERQFDSIFEFMVALDETERTPEIIMSTIDFKTEVVTVKEATKPITETLAQ